MNTDERGYFDEPIECAASGRVAIISPVQLFPGHYARRPPDPGRGLPPGTGCGYLHYFCSAAGLSSRLEITRSIMPYSTDCSGLMM